MTSLLHTPPVARAIRKTPAPDILQYLHDGYDTEVVPDGGNVVEEVVEEVSHVAILALLGVPQEVLHKRVELLLARHGVGSRLGTAHAGNKTVFRARRRCLELMLHLALDAFRLLRRGGLSDHGSLRNLTLPRGGADSLQLQGDASHQETLVLGDVSVGGVNGDVAGAAQERAVLVADDVHGVHLQC